MALVNDEIEVIDKYDIAELKALAKYAGWRCWMQPAVKVDKLIGRGGQGSVYKGYLIFIGGRLGNSVCVKTVSKGADDSALVNEVAKLKCLRNGTDPRRVGVRSLVWAGYDKNGNNSAYLEYVKYSLKERKEWVRHNARNVLVQLLQALSYVHERNIIHGDLKPSNILVTSKHEVKISDFGSSRFTWQELEIYGGFGTHTFTLVYAPPEYVLDKKHSVHQKGDVYSIGLAVYQIILGDEAFLIRSRKDEEVRAAIERRAFVQRSKTVALRYMGEATFSVLEELISFDVESRPTAVDALELLHDYNDEDFNVPCDA